MLETEATNTGENFALTKGLLESKDIELRSATVVSRPYQQRRAYATAVMQWPGLTVTCSSRPQALQSYLKTIGNPAKVIEMLVGDTQRIWVHAQSGFAIPQPVDTEVMWAFERLVAAGYTSRLI